MPNKKTCESRNKTNKKLRFLGNDITHSKTIPRKHNQVCMHRLDHACAYPCPENPKNAKIEQNFKKAILTP